MRPPRVYWPLFNLGRVAAEAEMDHEIESHIAVRITSQHVQLWLRRRGRTSAGFSDDCC
jgi:hypothetical protein